jgi:RNA polymerase sigma-70 factor (ECF subfamily)
VNHSDLSPPELFAICARERDAASWQEFIRRFNPVIARSVLRVAIRHGTTDRSMIEDLIQETYLKLCANQCKLLRSFTPQRPESAFGFLKVVAASVASDFFKFRLAEKRAPEATADSVEEMSPPSGPGCPKGTMNQTERQVLLAQIDRKLNDVVPAGELRRARTVFWLYYRSGFTARAIASLPFLDLTTEGVESLLFRLTRMVRENLSRVAGAEPHEKKDFAKPSRFNEGA